jgi:hypothetical protein
MIQFLAVYFSLIGFVNATLGPNGEGFTKLRIGGRSVLYRDQRLENAEHALGAASKRRVPSGLGAERQYWDYEIAGMHGDRVRVIYQQDKYGVPRVLSWRIIRKGDIRLTFQEVVGILKECRTIGEAVSRLGLVELRPKVEAPAARQGHGQLPLNVRPLTFIAPSRVTVYSYTCPRCEGILQINLTVEAGMLTGSSISYSGTNYE